MASLAVSSKPSHPADKFRKVNADDLWKALKSHKSPKILKSIAPCPVHTAVLALQNNAVLTIHESKGVSVGQVSYPAEIVAMAKGLFSPDRVYSFQMHASGTLASIAGGVINLSINWSPATTTFAEWSALSALFDEVKQVDSTLMLTQATNPLTYPIQVQVAVAPDMVGASSSVPTYTSTIRLANSEVLAAFPITNHSGGTCFKKHQKQTKYLNFATTASPAVSSPPSGCLGQWNIASNIVGTASTPYFFYMMCNVVKLRCRG